MVCTARCVPALTFLHNEQARKRALDLLPNAEANLAKLQEIADASAARLVKHGQEWEQHRQPMLAKYRRKKQVIQVRGEHIGAEACSHNAV